MQQVFAATGNPYIWWLQPVAEHATFAILDNWQKESAYSAGMTRVHNPPRVTYRYNPLLDDPAYAVVHDHWLSQLRTAATGVGDVDLATAGCGGSLPTTAPTSGLNLALDPVPGRRSVLRSSARPRSFSRRG